MEEEDGLDLEAHTTSRPVTPSPSDPSDGNGANLTPKAKTRFQPANPCRHPNMTDEEPHNGGEPQDEYMSDEEEYMLERIRTKLEDILDELMLAKESHIWPKLGAADWASCISKLIEGTSEISMDKHIINNLAETNVYLTKRVIELEHKAMNIEPETIQPRKPEPDKRTDPRLTQTSWAQVAANTHQ